MYQPLVSVVIATYNGEQFLAKQLDSIVNQTYSNIEVIVVDDRSTDGTAMLVNTYVEKYANVRLVVNEQNLGYVKNFEKGFLFASGDFIAPCDQDDIWDLHKLEVLVKNIGDEIMIYSDSSFIDSNGNLLGKRMSDVRRQIGYSDCLMYTIGAWAPGHAMLFKSSLIESAIPFPKEVSHDLWLGFVATFKSPIKYLQEPLVYYRQHDNNVFGGLKKGLNRKKVKKGRTEKLIELRNRMTLLYEKCPNDLMPQKLVFAELVNSYESFSLWNNWRRMLMFLKYRHQILAYKKKNELEKLLFCLKMFVMIK
jgi:glycosyltransferase involved in cell wall biosynthesis